MIPLNNSLLSLICLFTGLTASRAEIIGLSADRLVLTNGKVLENVEIHDVSGSGVILLTDNLLQSFPIALLPEELADRAREVRDAKLAQEVRRSERKDLPDLSTPATRYREQRLETIAANREAERQAQIEAAKAAAQNPPEDLPTIEWNDLRIHSASFGVGFGTAIVDNSGGTSRTLENWDLKVVYADGYSRSVRYLRPYRIERGQSVQIAFHIPDRYRITPQFLRFDSKRELLPARIDYVQTRSFGHRGPSFRSHGHQPYPVKSKRPRSPNGTCP